MKKLYPLFVLLLILATSTSFGQHPIPSFGVRVDSIALFAETSNCHLQNNGILAKREINIRVTCSGTLTCNANIWVYSLDGRNTYGPYQVAGGEILTVLIDDREWGVLVESDDEVIVDVWIDSPL